MKSYSSIQMSHVDESNNPSHVYCSFNIVNNDTTDSKKNPELKFVEIRNSPFLKNPSEYFVSCTRFYLETPTLPLFIPYAEIGQSNPNKLIYSVCLTYSYLGTSYEALQNVIWAPENVNEPIPRAPTVSQDRTSEYYFSTSYEHFTRLVNTALQNSFTALDLLVTGAGGTLPASTAPSFILNNESCLFTLSADSTGYDVDATDHINFYADTAFYKLFGALPIKYYGNNAINGKNYQYQIYNTAKNTVGSNFEMLQTFPTTSLWNPVKSIVFQSSLLPVAPEIVGTPVIFNSNTALTVGGNNNNISLQMTDFVASVNKGYEFKPFLLYSPQIYRLIDMFGNSPLNQFDLQVYWTDEFGARYPVTMFSGSSAQIMFMFRHKRLGA